jgi:aldehyde dehydrogenase (NAD+)
VTGFGTFTTMPLAGGWREGRAGKTGTGTDPWTGDTLTEIPPARAAGRGHARRRADHGGA